MHLHVCFIGALVSQLLLEAALSDGSNHDDSRRGGGDGSGGVQFIEFEPDADAW
jgi:hypothetical protein